MKNKNNPKPVILLAFANSSQRFLRNLPKERQEILAALGGATEKGHCEVKDLPYATIKELLDVFQDKKYKDRIAIFHFAGHAGDSSLIFETIEGMEDAAHKDGLVSLLSGQKELKLVFLNGCCTKDQAEALKEADVPAVIGTSDEIGDSNAVAVAARFYNGIANGLTIGKAWKEAQDSIHIKIGPLANGELYLWELYVKDGAEIVLEWDLPGAAGDPLFGLPEIPKEIGFPGAPFLYLQRYEKDHARVFFGRSREIRVLYDKIVDPAAPPIILLHGQSGVGKSSLLEAGLIPRLENNYQILFTRRKTQKGLLVTLIEVLDDLHAQNGNKEQPANPSLEEQWRTIESEVQKPLIVILDQVEEVYTHVNGNPDNEMSELLSAMKSVFPNPSSYPKGKLILSFRKEYYPEINDSLGKVKLDRSEEFLQPLDRDGIVEVVTGISGNSRLKQRYRSLEVEKGLAEMIAHELSKDWNSPIAPVLQILLTNMWQEALDVDTNPVGFTIDSYRRTRRQGIAMKDFLRQQMAKLQDWRSDVVKSGLVLDVLFYLTTGMGTAEIRSMDDLRLRYRHCPGIDITVHKLKYLYLLTGIFKKKRTAVSLAHDTLAPVVIEEYNESNNPGQLAARILSAHMQNRDNGGKKAWLNDTDLETVQQGITGMRTLTTDEESLLEISRKKRKQRKAVNILIILLLAVVVFAYFRWQETAGREKYSRAISLALQARLEAKSDGTHALRLAEKAYNTSPDHVPSLVWQALNAAASASATHPFYSLILQHERAVNSAIFSPGGNSILTASLDNTAKLWDIEGNLRTVFKGHTNNVNSASYSRDGTKVLTASRDFTAKLWSIDGNHLKNFTHDGNVNSAVFSPDQRWVLTASDDHTVKLWPVAGNAPSHTFPLRSSVNSAIFSPNGKSILTFSSDRTAWLWKPFTMSPNPRIFQGVISAVFSPGGRRIAMVLLDNTVKLMDSEGRVTAVNAKHSDRVTSAVFSPDGNRILTAYFNGTLKMWDLQGDLLTEFNSGQQGFTIAAFSPGGDNVITTLSDNTAKLCDPGGHILANFDIHSGLITTTTFSPCGTKILTASQDGTARLWDLGCQPTRELNHQRMSVRDVVLSPDGTRLLIISEDTLVRLLDLQGNTLANFNDGSGLVNTAVFSPCGTLVLTANELGFAMLWNTEGNAPVRLDGHRGAVNWAVFSPDGDKMLTSSDDHTAKLWDLQGELETTFYGHRKAVVSAVFSPDNKQVLTASKDHTAKLWTLMGKEISNFRFHGGPVTAAIFSPDGDKVLTISTVARLWDTSGRLISEYTKYTGSISSAVFSSCGKQILTASDRNTAKLWDLKGRPLMEFFGHNRVVNSAIFSPDGSLILTASADGTAKLWDMQGNILADFDSHHGNVRSAVFFPDGSRILSAAATGTVMLWQTPASIVRWLKTAIIPTLEEIEKYRTNE